MAKFAMLSYQTLTVTAFAQNCSIVWCTDTLQAAVIDPGGELPRIEQAARDLGVKIEQIWLTHGHIDHVGGAGELAQNLGIAIFGPHEGDRFWIEGLAQQSRMFGFAPAQPFVPTRWLQDGDELHLGKCSVSVHHTPGHTPGHVVFHAVHEQRLFVGDVLFAGSIGRTDFPGGSHPQLLASIREKLWPMGDDTVFIPGHGPESTLGHERRSNPFLR